MTASGLCPLSSIAVAACREFTLSLPKWNYFISSGVSNSCGTLYDANAGLRQQTKTSAFRPLTSVLCLLTSVF
jgi:hypothetical protein